MRPLSELIRGDTTTTSVRDDGDGGVTITSTATGGTTDTNGDGLPRTVGWDGGLNPIESGNPTIAYAYFKDEATIGQIDIATKGGIGSAVFDVWVKSGGGLPTSSDTITASDKPTITASAAPLQKTSFVGWSLTIPADSWLAVKIESLTVFTWAAFVIS